MIIYHNYYTIPTTSQKMYGGSIGLSMRQIYLIIFGTGAIVGLYLVLVAYTGYKLVHG